jgi:hypothetical protein
MTVKCKSVVESGSPRPSFVNRIFLLSPAKASGRRAQLLLRPQSNFELARRVQIRDATIGEVFAFCSGLYFRGKLAYANHFASTQPGRHRVYVITPTRGLLAADTVIGTEELNEFATVAVDAMERRFTEPLQATARAIAPTSKYEAVILGSIATGKYVEALLPVFGDRLLFPTEFVGRGDMSRGALMLRCVAANTELDYTAVLGAVRKGPRAAKVSVMQRASPAR